MDFCSNDYLGIARHRLLDAYMQPVDRRGSGGSRTPAGNSALAEATEALIASFHDADAALLFNSGFNANTGVLAAVPQRGDIILYDALAHASIRDGVRLSFAEAYAFRHNDMQDLEDKLRQHRPATHRSIVIATETVFSMDGHRAPLEKLVTLCERYDAHPGIDEAHALGIRGEHGEGLVQQAGLQEKSLQECTPLAMGRDVTVRPWRAERGSGPAWSISPGRSFSPWHCRKRPSARLTPAAAFFPACIGNAPRSGN